MNKTIRDLKRAVPALAFALAAPLPAWAGQGSEWNSAGGDRQNTRSQPSEHALGTSNVGQLGVKWALTTAGDVSATPAVDTDTVYVPDWAGYLYAVNRSDGQIKWKVYLPTVTGIARDKARATPALGGGLVVVGTQGSILTGPGGGPGAKVLAFNRATGALVWSTQADSHPAAIITQSATIYGGQVFVGVASQEEALAAFAPGYQLSFRGSFMALDLYTGVVRWKTVLAPQGYTGNAVWGSSPAVDASRGSVYIATGNNYSVPPAVLACIAAAGDNAAAQNACIAPDDHFDSVLSLDIKTGAIRWATKAIPYDAWTVQCFFGGGDNCPSPAGPDYDFGQAPALFKVRTANGPAVDRLGVGQKSGQYWSLDPDTGAVVWVTRAGPGGTTGGLQWGSASDGQRVYTADSNSNFVPWTPMGAAAPTIRGAWSGIDAVTGALLWQTVDPYDPAGIGGGPSGPVTTANGVVYACSLDATGHMYALNAATGAVLWSYASGGSCLSGAAIADGTLYWGSGYSNFGFGTPNSKLFAFTLPN